MSGISCNASFAVVFSFQGKPINGNLESNDGSLTGTNLIQVGRDEVTKVLQQQQQKQEEPQSDQQQLQGNNNQSSSPSEIYFELKLLWKGKRIQETDNLVEMNMFKAGSKKPPKIMILVSSIEHVNELKMKKSDPLQRGFENERDSTNDSSNSVKDQPIGVQSTRDRTRNINFAALRYVHGMNSDTTLLMGSRTNSKPRSYSISLRRILVSSLFSWNESW